MSIMYSVRICYCLFFVCCCCGVVEAIPIAGDSTNVKVEYVPI